MPADKRHELGRRGEDLAARFLRRNGFRIIDRNVRLAACEIDIIAREGDTVAFVEVRTVTNPNPVRPEDTVTPAKQAHLRRAAGAWISRHGDDETYYRFDIAAVVIPPAGKPEITLYRDAFPGR